jgi:plastocyanin
METIKYAFAGLALLAVAFIAFVVMGGNAQQNISAHTIDESAKPTYEAPPQQNGSAVQTGTAQEVSLTASSSGYDKTEIRVKAGVPVHFTFTANNAGCCAQLLIDKVGVQLITRNGQSVDATFTPQAPGNYPYHCGMNMCRGVLVAE